MHHAQWPPLVVSSQPYLVLLPETSFLLCTHGCPCLPAVSLLPLPRCWGTVALLSMPVPGSVALWVGLQAGAQVRVQSGSVPDSPGLLACTRYCQQRCCSRSQARHSGYRHNFSILGRVGWDRGEQAGLSCASHTFPADRSENLDMAFPRIFPAASPFLDCAVAQRSSLQLV